MGSTLFKALFSWLAGSALGEHSKIYSNTSMKYSPDFSCRMMVNFVYTIKETEFLGLTDQHLRHETRLQCKY